MMTPSNLEAVFEAGEFGVTGECGPPRGMDPAIVREKGEILKGYVDAVNVTDNQTAMVRMSSMAASVILKQIGLDPVMQMVCRDRNRIAMQSDILGAAALGISNLMCLSGDHQKFGDHPGSKNVYDVDSMQLIQIVKRMRDEALFAGGDEIKKGEPKIFIGAAANPFADPFSIRVPRLAKKAKAGANFIQTQCIFNLERFAEWMDGVVKRGLHEEVRIMGGVTPMKSFGMANYMAKNVAGMDVPKHMVDRMKAVKKEAEESGKEKKEIFAAQKAEGIKIAIETIEALQKMEGVSGVHIMAIEWEEAVPDIVKGAGLYPRPTPAQS